VPFVKTFESDGTEIQFLGLEHLRAVLEKGLPHPKGKVIELAQIGSELKEKAV